MSACVLCGRARLSPQETSFALNGGWDGCARAEARRKKQDDVRRDTERAWNGSRGGGGG